MYLSRLVLDQTHRIARRDLANCCQMHRTIMSAFPASDVNQARHALSVLYRVEIDRQTGRVVLLVQSDHRPDWGTLPVGYLRDDEDNPVCKPVDGAYDTLKQGMTLRFRLRANPTRKVDTKTRPDGTKSNGNRVPLTGEEALAMWLRRKAQAAGFQVLSVTNEPSVPAVDIATGARIVGYDDGRKLSFRAVQFDGVLLVEDVVLLRGAIRQGIGPGKAFGFGLLSIVPVS